MACNYDNYDQKLLITQINNISIIKAKIIVIMKVSMRK